MAGRVKKLIVEVLPQINARVIPVRNKLSEIEKAINYKMQ